MLHFFRRIRRDLLANREIYKYLKYAVGEILLVVLGILIALQINNWREQKKTEQATIQIYENLLLSLRQDSTDIERILKYQDHCVEAQIKLLTNSSTQIESQLEGKSIQNLLSEIIWGSASFFPNSGVYNAIISNGEIGFIDNNEIKVSLIQLYDHQYDKYANIDAIVDQKFQFHIFPVIDEKMTNYLPDSVQETGRVRKRIDKDLFTKHYDKLVNEIEASHRIIFTGRRLLKEIRESINHLIHEIQSELETRTR